MIFDGSAVLKMLLKVLEKSFNFIDLDLWEPWYQDNAQTLPMQSLTDIRTAILEQKSPLIVLIYKIVEVDKVS